MPRLTLEWQVPQRTKALFYLRVASFTKGSDFECPDLLPSSEFHEGLRLSMPTLTFEQRVSRVHFALRPQKRDGLLGTETGGEEDERVKARPRKPPEKDRRDRGPPPEQWKCYGGVSSPLRSD